MPKQLNYYTNHSIMSKTLISMTTWIRAINEMVRIKATGERELQSRGRQSQNMTRNTTCFSGG